VIEHKTDIEELRDPSVSVIICTLGTRQSLERCLQSVLSQSYPNFEVLVVLNGDSAKALMPSLKRYPVRLLYESHLGVCSARNLAIQHANGNVLCFIDDDAVAHPEWLREIVKGFCDQSVACAVGRVVPDGPTYFPSEDNRLYFGDRALSVWTIEPEGNWYQTVSGGNVIGFGCNMAFRADFLEKCTLFPEDLGAGSLIGAGDENYMYVQVLKNGFKIFHNPEAVVTHYFDRDPVKRKGRIKQLYAAEVAYKLKLLVEDKGHRWFSFQKFIVGFLKFLRPRSLQQPQARAALPKVLSKREQFLAYVKGISLFYQAQRGAQDKNSQPKKPLQKAAGL
jgi:glycosyltransferase involved in cell wall biosynthesis